ncbi:MAG: LPD28 domain-containing protein [Bacillota bacterium]
MARYNAMEESFEEIELFGKPALFTPIRIDRNTVPKGLCLYEVRHDDESQGDPVQIGKGILVNHLGTVITCEKLKLDKDGFLNIEPNDFNFSDGDCRTIKDFQEKYQIKIKKPHIPER